MGRAPIVVHMTKAEKRARAKLESDRARVEQEKAAAARADARANAEREKLLEKAGPNRKVTMAIASMTKALWKFELTAQQRADIKSKIAQYEKDLLTMGALEVDEKTLEEHMTFFSSSPELVQVMRAFWVCMMPYVKNGAITKEGYMKLAISLSYCLNGNPDEEHGKMAAEASWNQDQIHYKGQMNQEAFYDMLHNVATGWLDMFDSMSYCTLLWAIVDSVFDTSIYPPKFRLKRYIRCIMQADSEASRMQAWYLSRNHIEDIIQLAITNAATVTCLVTGTGNGLVPAKYYTEVKEELVQLYTYSEGDDARWQLQADPNLEMLLRQQDRKSKGTLSMSDEDAAIVRALAIAAQKKRDKEKKLMLAEGYMEDESDSDEEADRLRREEEEERERLAQSMTDSLSASQAEGAVIPQPGEKYSSRKKGGGNPGSPAGGFNKNSKGVKIAEQFKDGRSSWIQQNQGEGRESADLSFNYHQARIARIERSNNWIGKKKGNIFYNRGQYLKDSSTITGSFTSFIHLWMDEMGMTDDDVNYAMLAVVKAEWLNAQSRANQSSRLQARLDDDRKHLQNLHLKSTGLGVTGFTSSIHNGDSADGGSDLGTLSQAGSIGSFTMTEEQQRAAENVNMSVKEVMEMIRELQPVKTFGESIPAPWQYTRIPDIVMVGNGDIAVENKVPYTTSDYMYAPTYKYHAPEHTERTQSIVNSIRPQHPLRRMLDGGGSYAGTSGHRDSGLHYNFGSHINLTSTLQGGISFTDGTSIMTNSMSDVPSLTTTSRTRRAAQTLLAPPAQPASLSRGGSSSSVIVENSVVSQSNPGSVTSAYTLKDRNQGPGIGPDGDMDDTSQWSTLIGDDHTFLSVGGGNPGGRGSGRKNAPMSTYARSLVPGRYQRVHKDTIAAAAAAAAITKERAIVDKNRKQASVNALLQRCKKVTHIQKEEQSKLLEKQVQGRLSRAAKASDPTSTGATSEEGYSSGPGLGYGYGTGSENENEWSNPQSGPRSSDRQGFLTEQQLEAAYQYESQQYSLANSAGGVVAPYAPPTPVEGTEGMYVPEEYTVSTPIAPLTPLTQLGVREGAARAAEGHQSPLFLDVPDPEGVAGTELMGGDGSLYTDSWNENAQVPANAKDLVRWNRNVGGTASTNGSVAGSVASIADGSSVGAGSTVNTRKDYSITSEQTAATRESDFLEEVMFQRARMLRLASKDTEPSAASQKERKRTKGPSMREDGNSLFAPSASALPPSMLNRPSVVASLAQFQQKRGLAVAGAAGVGGRLEMSDDLGVSSEEEDMQSLGSNSLGSSVSMSDTQFSNRSSVSTNVAMAERQAQLAAKNGSNPNGIIYGKGTGGKEYRFMDPNDIVAEKVWVSQKSLTYESDKRWQLGGKVRHKSEQ